MIQLLQKGKRVLDKYKIEKLKPIVVETYKCPKCNSRIEGSYEEAQKHVEIPEDSPLPKGLVFRNAHFPTTYRIITSDGIISSNHGYTHDVSYYTNSHKVFSKEETNSKSAKEDFEDREYLLLEENEFSEIKSKCPINTNLIRTTPELEKIVRTNV